jgi:hypothetical protein
MKALVSNVRAMLAACWRALQTPSGDPEARALMMRDYMDKHQGR